MLENIFKYAIFLTAWGWTGFVVDQKSLADFCFAGREKRGCSF